jgi:hypothetical protein
MSSLLVHRPAEARQREPEQHANDCQQRQEGSPCASPAASEKRGWATESAANCAARTATSEPSVATHILSGEHHGLRAWPADPLRESILAPPVAAQEARI